MYEDSLTSPWYIDAGDREEGGKEQTQHVEEECYADVATGERMRQWTHSERPSPKGAREAQPGRDE